MVTTSFLNPKRPPAAPLRCDFPSCPENQPGRIRYVPADPETGLSEWGVLTIVLTSFIAGAVVALWAVS